MMMFRPIPSYLYSLNSAILQFQTADFHTKTLTTRVFPGFSPWFACWPVGAGEDCYASVRRLSGSRPELVQSHLSSDQRCQLSAGACVNNKQYNTSLHISIISQFISIFYTFADQSSPQENTKWFFNVLTVKEGFILFSENVLNFTRIFWRGWWQREL